MKRSIGFGIVVLIIATMAFGPASAQDNSQATISALQTHVAELNSTVVARGEKINLQRTQIADLKARVSDLESQVPTPTPDGSTIKLNGNGNQVSKKFTISIPGTYLLKAQNLNDRFLAVDVYTIGGDWVPGLSISTLD